MSRYTWPFRWLGLFLAILSIIKLVEYGFHLGWAAPFRLVADYYESLVHVFLGWLEPYLRSAVDYVNGAVGIHLHLHPHWRHFFVLLWLYFSADARELWGMAWVDFRETVKELGLSKAMSVSYLWARRTRYALSVTCWGVLVALFSALVCGVIPIESVFVANKSNLLFVTTPLIAFLLFRLGLIALIWVPQIFQAFGLPKNIRKEELKTLFRVLILSMREPIVVAVGLTICIVYWTKLTSLPLIAAISSASLVLLFSTVLGLSLMELLYERLNRFVGRHFSNIWFLNYWTTARKEYVGMKPPFQLTPPIQVTIALSGAALFILCNAGLKLVGL